MSEQENVGVDIELEDLDLPPGVKLPPCYGTWDASVQDCVEKCYLSDKCRRSTIKAQKEESLNVEEETQSDADPFDHMISMMSVKFSMTMAEKEGVKICYFRNSKGAPHARIAVAPSGKILIQTARVKLQLDEGFDSVQQVEFIFKAFIA